ncbi:oligosaccharide flippase family protein [Actinomadura sp. DC4]|uniref:oligosaccharide flippase family protein n=1 Tax=Actinomadura sp. DC4 TaxID=3055069 RepID=UPI0025B03ACE|nr:oligosaccharide flippase family protein [Actinomadura sp. DC4]MDN3352504.1 oligosaccharide flippase family protein [Actinomadura sp. DC4]
MTSEPHLSRLARGGALNLAGAASAGLMGFALVFAVAHAYPQKVAGAFFAATSLFVILNAVAGLGSDAGLLRWLPRHLALGDHGAARRTVPVALVPVVAVACAGALTLFVAAPALAGGIGGGQVAPMLRVLAVFLPVAAAHDALLAATRGHGTMRPTVAIEKIFRQVAQVAGVLAVSVVSTSPVALALAWALPYLIGLVVAVAWYLGIAGRLTTGPADTRALAGEFWRYTAPRSVAQICQTALQRADIVLIAALASPREAAIYTAATRFMVIGQLGTQAVQQAMQPAVSRLIALEDREGTARVFAGCTTWTVALTWPVHLSVAVAAPLYLSLFGHGYGSGQSATIILALAMLLASGTGPVDVMLLMGGRSGLSLANNAAALIVDLALNAVLIPWLGITGAAIAWAAALAIRNVLPLVQVHRIFGMTPAGAGLGFASGAALACFGALPLLARLTFGTTATLAGLVLGAGCYAGLLWAGRARLALTAFAALLPGRRATEGMVNNA